MKKQILLLFASILLCLNVAAYDFAVKNSDGVAIYYKKINNNTELEVTYKTELTISYSGKVNIPSSVTYHNYTYKVTCIARKAFYNCFGLTSITIPNSVMWIEEGAFQGCKGLTSLIIPNSLTHIGELAFEGCSKLTSVTIPNSVTNIGDGAFYGCSGLTSITIPNSVMWIGEGAFSNCTGINSIIVESGNKVFDSRDNCNAIIKKASKTLLAGCKNTVIPNSVTSIGNFAFYGCSGLTSITIPNSVTSFGNFAFYGCAGLTSITIPNSVTYIGCVAFSSCGGLKHVYYYAEQLPDTLGCTDKIFGDSNIANAILHVPANSVDDYRSDSCWKDFGRIVALTDADPKP